MHSGTNFFWPSTHFRMIIFKIVATSMDYRMISLLCNLAIR